VMFSNHYCNYNREVFSNISLKMPKGIIYLDIWMIKSLSVGLRGHANLEFRAIKNKPFQRVFEFDIDFCEMLNSPRLSLSRRLYLSMLRKGNFSKSCPLLPGYYNLYGWKADGNLVPSFLTFGDYRVTGTFYYGKFQENDEKPLFTCTAQANLV
ncbi:hypothetical protein KR215_005794, partial [Drosophila sulfurigaster]